MRVSLARLLATQTLDADARRRGRLTNILLQSALIMGCGLTAINLARWLIPFFSPGAGQSPNYALLDILVVLYLMGLLILNRAGHTRLASALFLMVCAGGVPVFFDPVELDRVLLIYAVPILASSFIVSPPSSFLAALFACVGYTVAYLRKPTPYEYNYVSMLSLGLMASVAWLIAQSVENALADVRSSLVRERATQDKLRAEIVERERVEEALERRAAQVALLSVIGSRIAATLELERVFNTAVGLMHDSFGYHHVAVFTLDREQGELVMRARAGNYAHLFPPDHRLKLGQGIVGSVGQQGGRLLANDVRAEPRYVNLYPDLVPTQSELAVPVRLGGENVGVLDIQSPQLDAFDQDDVMVIETLATQLAIALENARLYETVRRELVERRRVEASLRDSESRYRTLAESARDVLLILDRTGCVRYINPCGAALLASRPEEITGRALEQLWPPAIANQQWQDAQAALETGRTVAREMHVPLPGGEAWLEVQFVPILSPEGDVQSVLGWARDVTERKQAEEAFRQMSAQNKQLLTSIPSILISVGPDGNITHWNAPAEVAFGLTVVDVLGRPFTECPIPWDRDEMLRHAHECLSLGCPSYVSDVRYKRSDSKDGFLNVMINPVQGDPPGQSGFLVLAEDTTERKALEMRLMQASKLQAIGQLAAGIAHEINTPIQYIGDNLHFLMEAFVSLSALLIRYRDFMTAVRAGHATPSLTDEMEHAVEAADTAYLLKEIPTALCQSLEGVGRVTEIVRATREYSHPGTGNKIAVDLNQVIVNTVSMARNEWKYVAQVATDLEAQLPLVPCLPDEISQAFLNIIVNAAHAIADRRESAGDGHGLIAIQTRHDDQCVEVRIRDTGTGIPEAMRSRVFEPFFTTKPMGKGTGQGLAITHHTVVEKHQGAITFETEVGVGTTFIVRLPLMTTAGSPVS